MLYDVLIYLEPTEEEVEKWRKRDPLVRYQKDLVDKGLLSEDNIGAIEAEILVEIQAAVDGAEERMKALGDPIDMFEHAYDRLPAYLQEQKDDFAREIVEIALHREGSANTMAVVTGRRRTLRHALRASPSRLARIASPAPRGPRRGMPIST